MMFMNLNARTGNSTNGSSPLIVTRSSAIKSNQQSSKQIQQIFFLYQRQLLKVWSNRLVSNDNTISYEVQNYAEDKKNQIQQFFKAVKKTLKHTFTNTVYTPLTFYEFHMLDHLHKLYKEVPLKIICQNIAFEPYIPNFLQTLAFTKDVVNSQTVSKNLKSYVIKQIEQLIQTVKSINFAPKDRKKESLYTDAQTNILIMIITFKWLQKEYNPYVRRVIKRIFNQLSSDSFMNTMETLRYLQNERGQIQIMPQLSQKQMDNISSRVLMQTFDKYERKGQIPRIQLKKVSQDQRRKVVNILISGFLSQDQDKKGQWQNLLNCMPDSEVYGLDWQSQTMSELLGFMASSVGDLVFTQKTLEDKFKDNPFNPAFDVAQASGKYLAHVVDYLFPNQFINIIGYSLGTQLIKEFVKTTIEINQGKNLQKIVLLGGVSDTKEYEQILNKSPFPLSITNMYTANDSVLQMLLKRCRKGIQPIGLKELVKSFIHSIDNTDVSEQVAGHLAYMTSFGQLAYMLELSQE